MKTKQFQLVKQYVGSELLSYILNYDKISPKSAYEQLELLPAQIQVLDDLYTTIKQCRIQFIEIGGFGDGAEFSLRQITLDGASLFNQYRQICGGQLAETTSTDPLILFLQQICIKEYPNLLLTSSKSSFPHFPFLRMNSGMKDIEEFIRLVKNDILDNITNKKDGLEYLFQISTSNGLAINLQVGLAYTTIISRAFFNSCNRMDYSLSSVLKAIEENVNKLRQLANGQSITYSSFVGIRGIQFQGFDSIEFPGGVLRQFRDNANPGMHTAQTVVTHSENEAGEFSGHIFEIFHDTKIMSTAEVGNTNNKDRITQIQKQELQNLQFAVVFSTLANHGPVSSFFENGFPLIPPEIFDPDDHSPNGYIVIEETTKEKIVDWYSALKDKNLATVRIPLKRLQYAIFERSNPEDAILDAIIAWEGMFSGSSETTFKVTGSIAKFLRSGLEREFFYKKLNTLYKLRSNLVHGKTTTSSKNTDGQDDRAEVINIGLECIIKIIRNDHLLSLDAEGRCKAILILDELDSISTQQNTDSDAMAKDDKSGIT